MPKRYSPPNGDVCVILHDRLHDILALASHAKQAHWTVTGRNFLSLHEFFDSVFESLTGFADELAERIAAIGGQVKATVKHVAKGSQLPDYPVDITKSDQHIEAFSKALFQLKMLVRGNVRTVAELEDDGSADLLTSMSRKIDELCWMVGAQIEPK